MIKQRQALTLSDVQHKFALWRTRKSSGEKIPDSLWELVHALLTMSTYKRSVIGKTLGISSYQLKNKFPESCKPKQTRRTPAEKNRKTFVAAPLTTLMSATAASQLTIERPDGAKLTVSTATHEQCSILIKHFMESSHVTNNRSTSIDDSCGSR